MSEDTNNRWITDRDLERSVTASTPGAVIRLIESFGRHDYHRMLDIGCGYGGVPKTIGERFSISEIHGVDIDPEVLGEAQTKGVAVHCLDVDNDSLPFPDGHFDLVTCFGMLDYLAFFDHAVGEMYRVLQPGGHIVVSLPNLASWTNRLMLLFGYQLRDIEISRKAPVSAHPVYGTTLTGHIHTATPRAFRDFMSYSGFRTHKIAADRPIPLRVPWVFRLADRMLSKRATLARRFFYLGTKL